MTKRIYVCPGRYALVDDEDAPRVASVDWGPAYASTTMYARTNSARIGKSQQLMHRLIMRAAVGTIIDHINGDGLDNRRENLRFVTAQENALNRFGHSRFTKHKAGEQELSPFQKSQKLGPLEESLRSRRLQRFRRMNKRALEQAARFT